MKRTTFIQTLLISASLTAGTVNAEVHKLRLGHFWPAGSSVDVVINDWADTIAKESNGELKIEVYPTQTLAKAAQSYNSTVNGIADITVTAQGYMAGRFPLTQVIELPGIVKTAENASCVLQSLYDTNLIASEYTDTRPLFFFAHGPGHIHTSDTLVEQPDSLQGKRIRRATTVVAEILSSLEAQPVGMPAPDTYTAAQRRVIDGVAFPWQAMKDFRLNEQLTHHTELALYTLSFLTTMNKNVYAELPDHLKEVLDRNSGMEWSKIMGRKLDDLDAAGRAEAVAAGHTIGKVEDVANNPAWKPVLDQVVQNYLTAVKTNSIQANEVYRKALEYKDTCDTI